MVKGQSVEEKWERELAQKCHQLGIRLSEDQVRSFWVYVEHLRVWNPRIGLISARDEPRVMTRHFLDSLGLLTLLDLRDGARVLDVGSGGGFPGLPLKICRPGIFLTLLEQKEKRFFFLKSLVKTLGLERVYLCHRRAQEAHQDLSLRERFDLVLARAVAGMEKLICLCFPFVREGGLFVAYKGRRVKAEMAQAFKQIEEVSGELLGMVRIKIPGGSAQRYLVMIQKFSGEKKHRWAQR